MKPVIWFVSFIWLKKADSTVLSNVFDPQNPVPSCMIFTGVNRFLAIWSPLSYLLSVLSASDIF